MKRRKKKSIWLWRLLGLLVLFAAGFLVRNGPCWTEEVGAFLVRDTQLATLPTYTRSRPATMQPPQTNTNGETIPTDTEDTEENPETIRLQFAGDVFLHQGPLDAARTGSNTFDFWPFLEHISPYINGDFVIANMESPVDAFGGNQQVAGWPYFNAPFEILEALTRAGFNHLSTANNHAFDKGMEGLLNTVGNLNRAGITHTGLSVNQEDFDTHTLIDVGGITIGVLAYTDVVNHQGLALMPQNSLSYAVRRFESTSLNDMPRMTNDITNLRAAGAELVVVSLHWGVEYDDEPTPLQRVIAEQLVDAGADIIMGHHSKTIQPVEWHTRADGSRGLIMYSLGNFVADQTRLFPNATSAQEVLSRSNDSGLGNHVHFAGRTQFGALVSVDATRDDNGNVELTGVNVLPTLAMRDFSGTTLGRVDMVGVMPLSSGQLPEFVTNPDLRQWGQVAYEHINTIINREFIGGDTH